MSISFSTPYYIFLSKCLNMFLKVLFTYFWKESVFFSIFHTMCVLVIEWRLKDFFEINVKMILQCLPPTYRALKSPSFQWCMTFNLTQIFFTVHWRNWKLSSNLSTELILQFQWHWINFQWHRQIDMVFLTPCFVK